MPLHKIEKIGTNRYLAIWHVEEADDTLLNLLNPDNQDLELLSTYHSHKKKLEWLSGRLCLKHLCEQVNMTYSGVTKNSNGKPFLKNNKAEISLTHSFPYVAAILDKNTNVGIDLEQPKEKLKKVATKFLNTHELKAAGDDVNMLCIYWCAKETLYKLSDKNGISFKNNMYIEPFDMKTEGSLQGNVRIHEVNHHHKLEYRIEKDYIMVFSGEQMIS